MSLFDDNYKEIEEYHVAYDLKKVTDFVKKYVFGHPTDTRCGCDGYRGVKEELYFDDQWGMRHHLLIRTFDIVEDKDGNVSIKLKPIRTKKWAHRTDSPNYKPTLYIMGDKDIIEYDQLPRWVYVVFKDFELKIIY